LVVIDDEGEKLGEMPRTDALALAYGKGLDLVEINPTSRPPVCKIMDFGKFKYDQAKKQKENKARQKEVELKEIRLTFKIGDHDIEYKAKNAREFFDQGDRVKVSMRLRGRENAFIENALLVFRKFADEAGLDYEGRPFKAGNQITAMMTEKKVVKETKIDTIDTINKDKAK
jgi:translation initiation factor IF-3